MIPVSLVAFKRGNDEKAEVPEMREGLSHPCGPKESARKTPPSRCSRWRQLLTVANRVGLGELDATSLRMGPAVHRPLEASEGELPAGLV